MTNKKVKNISKYINKELKIISGQLKSNKAFECDEMYPENVKNILVYNLTKHLFERLPKDKIKKFHVIEKKCDTFFENVSLLYNYESYYICFFNPLFKLSDDFYFSDNKKGYAKEIRHLLKSHPEIFIETIKIKKFAKKDEPFLLNMSPDLIYLCDDGGMGPSGMLLVMDGNIGFVLNHNNKNESKLWDTYINSIKGLNSIYSGPLKRKHYIKEKSHSIKYLGVGNIAYVCDDAFNLFTPRFNNFPSFRKFLYERYGFSIEKLYKLSVN